MNPVFDELTAPSWYSNEVEALVRQLTPRVVGLEQLRSALVPMSEDDSDDDSEMAFSIDTFHVTDPQAEPDAQHVLLLADLAHHTCGYFTGITYKCHLRVAKDAPLDDDQLKALGFWAVHLMYDIMATAWKTMVSGVLDFNSVEIEKYPKTVQITASRFPIPSDEKSKP